MDGAGQSTTDTRIFSPSLCLSTSLIPQAVYGTVRLFNRRFGHGDWDDATWHIAGRRKRRIKIQGSIISPADAIELPVLHLAHLCVRLIRVLQAFPESNGRLRDS